MSLGKMIFSRETLTLRLNQRFPRVQGESLGLDAPWAHPEPFLIFVGLQYMCYTLKT